MIKEVSSECLNGILRVTFEADCNNIDDVDDIIRMCNYIKHMHDEQDVCEGEYNDNEYNEVGHPSHYCQDDSIECIDEMLLLYGKGETMSFCKLNSHKYRKRAFDKGGIKDIKKSDWYIKKYMELRQMNEYEIIENIKEKYNQ